MWNHFWSSRVRFSRTIDWRGSRGILEETSRLQSARVVLMIIICVALLALHQTGRLDFVQGNVFQVFAPAQASLRGIANTWRESLETARDLRTLRQRNRELEELASTLTVENLRLQEVEAENEALRGLLDFAQSHPTYDIRGGQIIGRVIAQDPSSVLQSVTIDLGARHGIRVGMPVVTERGLVGRISHVYQTTAKVLLITDPDSQVNVILQNSRLLSVMRGQSGDEPVLEYIDQDAEFHVGEIVLTSGLGGNFPRNLIIGQVTEIYQRDYEMFQRAVVRPTVDFDRLENILVITNFEPVDLEAAPEAEAEANGD